MRHQALVKTETASGSSPHKPHHDNGERYPQLNKVTEAVIPGPKTSVLTGEDIGVIKAADLPSPRPSQMDKATPPSFWQHQRNRSHQHRRRSIRNK